MKKKWIKLLADYDGQKSGAVVEVDEAVANTLVTAKIAEATEAPKQVEDEVKKTATELKTFVTEQIGAAVSEGFKALKDELTPASKGGSVIIVGKDRETEDPTMGFKSAGEFFRDVNMHVIRGSTSEKLVKAEAITKSWKGVDPVTKAPTNWANEAVGADGGFLLPPQYATEILREVYAEESLMQACRNVPCTSNVYSIPTDETTPWGGEGVQAYWDKEANTLTDTKPKIGQAQLVLNKLTVLVPVTNEMLEDAPATIGGYINAVAPERIAEKVNGAIIRGTGVGQPLGILNAGALITQNKTASQAASTFTVDNAASMLARLKVSSAKSVRWLYHSTVFPQIVQMVIGQQPMFVAAGNIGATTNGSLFGYALSQSEQCSALTTLGDMIVADLSKYMFITKTTPIRAETSMHVYFDRDLTAYKFVFRGAGQPVYKAPFTDKNGGGSKSHFVTLQAR